MVAVRDLDTVQEQLEAFRHRRLRGAHARKRRLTRRKVDHSDAPVTEGRLHRMAEEKVQQHVTLRGTVA